jgi:hypothetical protein
MRRCRPFRSVLCLKSVYFSYVRCLLEYASQIWYPYYAMHVNKIERILKMFIAHLNYKTMLSKSDYRADCRLYNLLLLEERRSLFDMGLLYDMLHYQIDCPEFLAGISFNTPKKRTRHTTAFSVPGHSTKYGQNCVLTRLVRTYTNSFSNVDIFIGSKKNFKQRVSTSLVNE